MPCPRDIRIYLALVEVVCAIIGSLQVVLKGTPMHDPSTRVLPVKCGLSEQDSGELVTTATNWRGVLLGGCSWTVSSDEVKSSIWSATKNTPGPLVARWWSSHCSRDNLLCSLSNNYNTLSVEQTSLLRTPLGPHRTKCRDWQGVLISEVVLYTSLCSWDNRQCPD